MMAEAVLANQETGLGRTERRDLWWVGPLVTGIVLASFVVYSTFRVFYNAEYVINTATSAYILSPFYSPLLVVPSWMPTWISPAMFILWMPGGFRVTCYYYRKAYYRAFFLDPPGCAVGEARGKSYRGETRMLLFQNLHRYFMYLAVLFLFVLAYDAIDAMMWPTGDGHHTFGISIGTLALIANVTLLSLYTFSCHSLRHLVGGNVDCFSCVALGQVRYSLWKNASILNKNHMLWAWLSLFGVALTDLYVWLVAAGHLTDLRII